MKHFLLIIGVLLIVVGLSPIFDSTKETKSIQNSEMELTNDFNDQEKFEESLNDHQENVDRVESKLRKIPVVTKYSSILLGSGLLLIFCYFWILTRK